MELGLLKNNPTESRKEFLLFVMKVVGIMVVGVGAQGPHHMNSVSLCQAKRSGK